MSCWHPLITESQVAQINWTSRLMKGCHTQNGQCMSFSIIKIMKLFSGIFSIILNFMMIIIPSTGTDNRLIRNEVFRKTRLNSDFNSNRKKINNTIIGINSWQTFPVWNKPLWWLLMSAYFISKLHNYYQGPLNLLILVNKEVWKHNGALSAETTDHKRVLNQFGTGL